MQTFSSNQPGLDDDALIEKYVQRDVIAFERIYDRYAQPVYVLAVYMLGQAEAEEAVQEVFLRLWNKADKFDAQRGNLKSWLMSVARNYMLDRLKRRNLEWRFHQVEKVDQILAEAKDTNPDVLEQVWARERLDIILHALETLPSEQRRAIVMAYFGGLSQSAIAQHMDWPLGTVKKRIRLGLQKLRAALQVQKEMIGHKVQG